ncbi:hypothetical protein NMG60_11034202 [Bertholletia excelsa]
MGVKIATTASLQLSQPSVPLRGGSSGDGALIFRCIQTLDRSSLFGTKLYRSRSCDLLKSKSGAKSIRRACSASLDAFSDEEFSKQIRELAMKFQYSDGPEPAMQGEDSDSSKINSNINFLCTDRPFDRVEPPDFPANDDEIPAAIERKANSVDLPLSLRIIKRKKEGFREAGESAAKKAFSSMVFIIRELHSFTLQMRETVLYDDLQGILERVQREIHASFVWLFQQVFSHTPTLMVSVMILLANYSVHSMACNPAIASPPPKSHSVSVLEDQNQIYNQPKFDSSAIKTFSVSASSGKTASIGGGNGGGGKFQPVASGTDGDDGSDERGSLNCQMTREEEEKRLWNSIVEEATTMQAGVRAEWLDSETVQGFVSPVSAKIEEDEYAEYLRTELVYRTALTQDPNNPLLLANFAQFLFVVAHDYDRAEEYFKRAAMAEPPDAEALSKYANFLWQAKKDLWAAEETYLAAISADPGNSHYAANYAHFLWNTGGEDTCFPLDNDADEA